MGTRWGIPKPLSAHRISERRDVSTQKVAPAHCTYGVTGVPVCSQIPIVLSWGRRVSNISGLVSLVYEETMCHQNNVPANNNILDTYRLIIIIFFISETKHNEFGAFWGERPQKRPLFPKRVDVTMVTTPGKITMLSYN